jgi:serine carboxypeptidase 1
MGLMNYKRRNSSLNSDFFKVKDFNVLFVDNPVGTGYSYVENLELLTTNNEQIAADLIALMLGFYDRLPQFRDTPLYVYGQSYGGKMAVDFVRLLYRVNILTSVGLNHYTFHAVQYS